MGAPSTNSGLDRQRVGSSGAGIVSGMDKSKWDARYEEGDLLWSAGPNEFLADQVATLVPGTVLDLGAGEGRNAIWLAGEGWQATALDFSSVGLRKAALQADVRGVEIEFIVDDVTTFDLGTTFDLVLIFYVHLPPAQFEAMLGRARVALSPGGTILGVGHALRNLEHGHGGPPDPSILWTEADVRRHLGPLDHIVIEERTRAVEIPDTDESATAIDLLFRATAPI